MDKHVKSKNVKKAQMRHMLPRRQPRNAASQGPPESLQQQCCVCKEVRVTCVGAGLRLRHEGLASTSVQSVLKEKLLAAEMAAVMSKFSLQGR